MNIHTLPFLPANILLPKEASMPLWSVVACDQYTSQPEYWKRVEQRIGREYSTLRMILPESRLKDPDVEMQITQINHTMTQYLHQGVFQEYPNSIIYVERRISNGKIRRGLIGKVDLAQYDYTSNSNSMIRSTEGTILERIPPRVMVRRNAPIEFPHILLLMDDIERTVVEPLAARTAEMELLYDFELMEGGGHIKGWMLTEVHKAQVAQSLEKLADPQTFQAKYGTENLSVMLFAVGDGNHSLATAKECYEQNKRSTKPEEWPDLLSRYALVELGNLHDESLEFEPIHRMITGVDPEQLLKDTNCCVIDDNKPHFLTISDVLRKSVDNTMALIRKELEIRKGELLELLHFASLEKIFIEERIYKDRQFEQAPNMDAACEHIDNRLTPFYPQFIREVTKDDILRLMEIKMARILRFNKDRADEAIARMNGEVEEIDRKLNNMIEVTSDWYKMLKEKYGKEHPRMTELRNFDTIEAAKVAEANEKLYINREEGFIGTSLKKDEFVDNCSDIDDVILFYKDGKYKIVRVSEKMFVGKNVLHVGIFKKNDKRTVYNVVYRDGKEGFHYIKRFSVTAMTRDREYDLTQGTPGSRIAYFSANPNGEAEIIKITLKPNPRVKKLLLEKDFSEISIKGRQSQGNILTKFDVHRIGLKQRGGSTLGGRQVWYDWDVQRLNYDGRGQYLGEFHSEDMILVVLDGGDYYLTNFDVNNHYETNIKLIEKYDPSKVWTVALFDADNSGYPYLKRFMLDATIKRQNYLGENKENREILCSVQHYPRIQVMFGGNDSFREPLVIDAEEFIAVKSFKAKGKRITTFEVAEILELEPTRYPTEEELAKPEPLAEEPVNEDPDAGKSESDILDELTGQMKLF